MRSRAVLLVAALAVLAVPSGAAAAPFKFGSKLATDVQPQPGQPCRPAHPQRVCTWIMNEAVGRPNGGERSPRAGTMIRLRVIAEAAGSFRLQIARARKTGPDRYEGKVVRNGPSISYAGQPDEDDPYRVETFTVNIPVKKGDRLAIRKRATSALRCGGGGDGTLLFYPALAPGGAFKRNTDDHDCLLLLEAVVRPAG